MIVKSDQFRYAIRQRLLFQRVMETSSWPSDKRLLFEQDGDLDDPTTYEKGGYKIAGLCGNIVTALLSILPGIGNAFDACDFIAHMVREELVMAVLTLACLTPVVGEGIKLAFIAPFKLTKTVGARAWLNMFSRSLTGETIYAIVRSVSRNPDDFPKEASAEVLDYITRMWGEMISIRGGLSPLVELSGRVADDAARDVPGAEAFAVFLTAMARLISEQVHDAGPAGDALATMIRRARRGGLPDGAKLADASDKMLRESQRIASDIQNIFAGKGAKIIGASSSKTVVMRMYTAVADSMKNGIKAIDDATPLPTQIKGLVSNTDDLIRTWGEAADAMGIPRIGSVLDDVGVPQSGATNAIKLTDDVIDYMSAVVIPLRSLEQQVAQHALRVTEPYSASGVVLLNRSTWRGLGQGTGKLKVSTIEQLIAPSINSSKVFKEVKNEMLEILGSIRAILAEMFSSIKDPSDIVLKGERGLAEMTEKIGEKIASWSEKAKPAMAFKSPLAMAKSLELATMAVFGFVWIMMRWGSVKTSKFTDWSLKFSPDIVNVMFKKMGFGTFVDDTVQQIVRYQVRKYPGYKVGIQALKRMWSTAATAHQDGDPAVGALGGGAFPGERIPWEMWDRINWSRLGMDNEAAAVEELEDVLDNFGIDMRKDTRPGDLKNGNRDGLDGSGGEEVRESLLYPMTLAEIL